MAKRRCQQCGEIFQIPAGNPDQRYCGVECRDASMRQRVVVHCAYCGKPKEITPSTAKSASKHYCDRECYAQGKKGRSPANKADNDIVCGTCGRTFHSSPSNNQKFCSRKCADVAHAKHLKDITDQQSAKARVRRICQQCGKAFTVTQGVLNRAGYDTGKFCSRECQVERKRQIRGNAHPLKVPYAQLTCQWCGKPYEVKPSLAKVSKFCGKHCQGAWAARNMSRKETAIEATIRSLLDQMGVSYIQECAIDFYTCDFVIESSRLVIECDGTYWHGLVKVLSRDKRKDKLLSSKGYKILRLPESRIRSDLEWCRQQILKSL